MNPLASLYLFLSFFLSRNLLFISASSFLSVFSYFRNCYTTSCHSISSHVLFLLLSDMLFTLFVLYFECLNYTPSKPRVRKGNNRKECFKWRERLNGSFTNTSKDWLPVHSLSLLFSSPSLYLCLPLSLYLCLTLSLSLSISDSRSFSEVTHSFTLLKCFVVKSTVFLRKSRICFRVPQILVTHFFVHEPISQRFPPSSNISLLVFTTGLIV